MTDLFANILSSETLLIGARLGVAMILGMIIGAERILAHKTAGMRTYALCLLSSR